MKLAVRLSLLMLIGFYSVAVQGLQCSSHEILKRYQMDKFSTLTELERDTPPSKTTEKWWINPCEEHKDNVEIPSGCNNNDMLCGITEVSLPNKDAIISQIIDFSKSMTYSVEELTDKVILTLKSTKWGSNNIDAQIEFECNSNMKVDEVVSTTWQNQQIQLALRGPSGCLKKDTDGDRDKNKNGNDNKDQKDDDSKKSGGLSWFTWIVVYALLVTVIYLVIVSYMNTRGGSFDDFRGEFIERGTQFVTSLPDFAKEIALKIFGRTPSSERGGYSAV